MSQARKVIVEACHECGSTNPHCCKQPIQLLEVYTDRDPLVVTSLGFFDTYELAKEHLEDFLRVEVIQDEKGKLEDYFQITVNEDTDTPKVIATYVSDGGDFEWHIIKV